MAGAQTYEDWSLVLLTPWGTIGIVLATLAAAVALGLVLWSYRNEARRRLALLLALTRALAVSAVLLFVLQPGIQMRSITRLPNHVALLLDLSASMAIREEPGRPSRIERAAALLKRSHARIQSWRRERVVNHYSFGAALSPLAPVPEALRAEEPETDIQGALEELRQRQRGKDLAAVILISDGVDTARLGTGTMSGPARRFLSRLGFPVHTIWSGGERLRDLAVADIHADHFAFVRNAVKLEVDLVAWGLPEGPVAVTLSSGGAAVAQRTVRLRPERSTYRVALEFVPQEVGKYVYTVSVPVQQGEALSGNNSRSFLLKVIRDRIRVLQLCGRPSWDERFLRHLLKRDPNVDLISFFILRTHTDLIMGDPSELSLIPFPTEELFEKELGSFDLVVLQNFNYGPYGIGTYLPLLRRYVEGGGGLAMVGGDLSFSSGQYAETPIAEVLPLRLTSSDREASRLVSTEEFRPRPTREGREHPILQLGQTQAESLAALSTLPSFVGVNLVPGVMPGTTVLLVHPTLRDESQDPMPVLAVREVGKGRTLALTTDSLWRWAFLSPAEGRGPREYDRLWRNAIRWLIRDPELKYLRIIAEQEPLRQNLPLKVQIRASRPDYTPAAGVQVTYEVVPDAGGKGWSGQRTTDALGEVLLELRPRSAGAYHVQARAVLGGRPTVEKTVILVEPPGKEEQHLKATPALLKKISALTGGRYLGQVAELPALDFREPRSEQVNWRRDLELWSRWWSFLSVLLLLGLDWGLRRKLGYL